MIRDIGKLETANFDILIIGGGITGSAIAWDAALRGHKTALIEKKDFGHATSSATSKLIHGGLRYLAKFDLPVVRESLRERRLLEQNLPHQAFPLPFLMPLYEYSSKPRWMLNLGLFLYDLLSYDKNELKDPDKHLDSHKWLSKEETLKLEPFLETKGLKGSYRYYDVLNRHPERSNLDYILSASEKGAVCANYIKFEDFIFTEKNGKKTITAISANDEISGKKIKINAKIIVNATGPWGDIILSKIQEKPTRTLLRSKGIHLLFPKFHNNNAITIETRDKHHFFIVPWLNYSLIGTTDTKFTGDLENVKVTQDDVHSFLHQINMHIPVKLKEKDIVHAYAGIRPMVSESKAINTYEASRKHEIINHEKTDSIKGLVSVFGGKWTTSRSLAEETVDKLEKISKLKRVKSKTKVTPLSAGNIGERYSVFVDESVKKWSSDYSKDFIKRLIEYYGSHYENIIDLMKKDNKLSEVFDKDKNHVKAEIVHAIENEMAHHLDDILLRRCCLGNSGPPSKETLKNTVETMGKLLNWSKKQQEEEINKYLESQKIVD
ncbi:MAG: glycerol-3-phosphate dehydrogenase/oxidase [Spirochaetia bacterium]|nr:glycerol-3-phosphate dehydrogenase/oxidase [Spirochaetia bacterium]